MRFALLSSLLLVSCSAASPPPAEQSGAGSARPAEPPPASFDAAVPGSGIRIRVSPADAEVFVNGLSLGAATSLEPVVELEPGLHQLTIRRDGYRTWRAEFTVDDEIESFVVKLEPLSP